MGLRMERNYLSCPTLNFLIKQLHCRGLKTISIRFSNSGIIFTIFLHKPKNMITITEVRKILWKHEAYMMHEISK